MISERVKAMDVSAVRKMFEMAASLENPVDLTIGLPDFDVPDAIKQEALDSIVSGANRYTPTMGIAELREAISDKLKQDNGIEADSGNIMVTSAVSGGISVALTTILDPGDEVILFDPYFVLYKQVVIQNGAVPVYSMTKSDFSLDLDDMERKITARTKAVMVNSPNNPTGKVYDRRELEGLARVAGRHGLTVLSDEIYEAFVYEKKHFSIGSIYDRTVTLNGFSKSYAMTGWRVGYMTGPKEIISNAVKVQQFNFVCAPTPFQYAALKAFGCDMGSYRDSYRKKRDMIYDGMKGKYDILRPEGAFYAYVKYPYEGNKFVDACLANNMLIVPGHAFSEKDTHFRISFATSDKTLEKAIGIFDRIA